MSAILKSRRRLSADALRGLRAAFFGWHDYVSFITYDCRHKAIYLLLPNLQPTMKQRRKSQKARDFEQPDPGLVERLNRAVGAHQFRTGDKINWKELGEAAHLTPSTMTSILSLERKVTIREAVAFADRLSVHFAWLAIGTGPMVVLSPDEAAKFGNVPVSAEAAAADLFARRAAERTETEATKRRRRPDRSHGRRPA